MKRRQVLATTTGLLAGAGCVGIFEGENTWEDIEDLQVIVENQREEEYTARIRLQNTEMEHSMEKRLQPGETYDWILPSPSSSDSGEPSITIGAQGHGGVRTTQVRLADLDCQTVIVRAVFVESDIETETECGEIEE